MKITSAILFTILVTISFSSFAKESKITLKTEKTTEVEESKIRPFDFPKLFSEAETYFKAAKAWNKLKCEPKTGFICTKRECNKRDTKAYVILDKKKETITRCEGENCETVPAQFKQTGVFFNIQSDGPIGTLIRILGDSRYKEITTVGLDAYIANGNCEVVVGE
jgi:hypothetical protein